MPQDRQVTDDDLRGTRTAAAQDWFKLVAASDVTVGRLQAALGANPELLAAVNPSEASVSDEAPQEIWTVLGASKKGMNALSAALIAFADLDIVGFLVDAMTPAQLNAQWGSGNTALHLAAVLGNADAVGRLIAKGADVTIRNKFGMLPINMAHEPETADMFTPMETEPDDHASAAGTKRPHTETGIDNLYKPLYQDVARALHDSPTFSRPSFGAQNILDVVQRAGPTSSRAPTPKATPRPVPVIHYTGAGVPSAVADPYRDRTAYTIGPVTVEAASATGGSPASTRKARKDLRKSLVKLVEAVQVHGLTDDLAQAVAFKLFVRIVDIKGLKIDGIKDDTKLYLRISLGAQVQFSLEFSQGSPVIAFNDEFQFPVTDLLAPHDLLVQLYRRKTSWTDKFSPMRKKTPAKSAKTGADDSELPQKAAVEARDELIAQLYPRTLPDLGLFCAVERQVSKANNAFYRDDFVCCATTPRNVLGIMTLDFYVHTNRAASCVPKSMSDCTRLVQERQDALSKVWCEGVVTVSDGMLLAGARIVRAAQDWRRRAARLQRGELQLFDEYYPTELRDVKSLSGLKEITLMTKEECDVPYSFKITTETSFWYMFTSNRAEQEQWISAMFKMMAALEGPRTAAAPASTAAAPVSAATTPSRGSENVPPAGATPSTGAKTLSAITPRHRARLNL